MSWLFISCDQNTGTSTSASVLPTSIQGWFPLRLTDLISLLSKGLSEVFSSSKSSILQCSPFFKVQVSQPSVSWEDQCYCSVAQLCMTLCDPHGLQHASLPCPLPSPTACSNSCPLSQWCHPTILSSVIPFFSCLQSFPASGSFFQWFGSLHQVAKVLEFQFQHQSFQWIFMVVFL